MRKNLSLLLAYTAFLSLGLPDGLIGVAWPYIRQSFGQPLDALAQLLLPYTAGYLLSSFSSGMVLGRIRIGLLLALSCGCTAAALLGFAASPAWLVLPPLSLIAGLGAGAIDAGLNTYAAQNFSPRAINWLHAFYGIGAALGPPIMTRTLMWSHRWQSGYQLTGVAQLLLTFCFLFTVREWQSTRATASEARVKMASTLRLPVTWFGMLSFFLYTGLESAAGVWLYSLLTQARAIDMETAGNWVGIYWFSLTAGRILSGAIAKHVSANWILRSCCVAAAIGSLLLRDTNTFVAIALIGFSFAPIFPTLIAATPRWFQAHTRNAVGLQIAAAMLGASILPSLFGAFAETQGLQQLPALLFWGTAALTLLLAALHISSKKVSTD